MSKPIRVKFPFGVCSIHNMHWAFPANTTDYNRRSVEACYRIYPIPSSIPVPAIDQHMAEAAAYELKGEILENTEE
jgi:hypothetical protein